MDGRRKAKIVSAERPTAPVRSYTGHQFELSEQERLSALRGIKEWKLEARSEDTDKYFFQVPEIPSLLDGSRSYVIGRKGTGKTAIAQYIILKSKNAADSVAESLSFKSFPFQDMYKHQDEAYTRPNQYITIWKYLIYSHVCRMMAGSPFIESRIRKKIERVYPSNDSRSLDRIFGQWSSGDFSLSILGSGISVSNWFRKHHQTTFAERVEILEDFISTHCDGRSYRIIFDELDEDYKDTINRYKSGEYLDLLTSLFKAVQAVRAVIIARQSG